MSASAKKKLRKEQNAAQLTEKQRKEQQEAKKLKLYTGIFLVAIAVVLVAGIVITGVNIYKNSGIVEKNTVAAVVNGEEINAVELSYYYTDMVSTTYSEWETSYGDSLSLFLGFMGLDTTLPLDEQSYSDELTWADYFVDMAVEKAKSDSVLCAAAEAEGYQMTEDEQLTLQDTLGWLDTYALLYGYNDTESYLRSIYGPGADLDSYTEYSTKASVANSYYLAHQENLNIDDAAIRAYEAENYSAFSSFSFATYHLSYTDYLTGGTEDEEGNMVYTEAEEEAARAAALADAELLAKSATVEELDAAIADLPQNEDALGVSSTEFTDSLYSSTSTMYRDWLAEDGRKAGDCTVVTNNTTVTAEDGTTKDVANDLYVVLYLDRNDNTMPLANVRHILVEFEGGTTDDDGNTTYTDEEKATAKAEAEAILAELTADGTVTDDEFAAAATEKTDDTGSTTTGGLYEDITPEDGVYVEEFKNWAVDESRKTGDTGIIETVYGYHVMYYVGDDEMTYRDYMITNEITTETMDQWYNGLLENATSEKKDTSRLNTDIVLSTSA